MICWTLDAMFYNSEYATTPLKSLPLSLPPSPGRVYGISGSCGSIVALDSRTVRVCVEPREEPDRMGAIKATTKKRSDTTIPYWEVDQSLQDKTLETCSGLVFLFVMLCHRISECGFLPSSRPVGWKPRRRGETQTTATWAAQIMLHSSTLRCLADF